MRDGFFIELFLIIPGIPMYRDRKLVSSLRSMQSFICK